jgi:hypothetical protein
MYLKIEEKRNIIEQVSCFENLYQLVFGAFLPPPSGGQGGERTPPRRSGFKGLILLRPVQGYWNDLSGRRPDLVQNEIALIYPLSKADDVNKDRVDV